MSETKKIGAKIVLDGEKEFNQSLRNSKTALKEFDSELKLTSAQFKNNEKSLEALQRVQKTYVKQQQELQKQEKAYVAQIEKASDARKEALTIHEKTAQKVENLRKELEQAQKTYGENSQEVEKLNKSLTETEREFEKEGTAISNLDNKMSKWQTGLNETRIELANTDNKLRETNEAIDNYGKEVEDAEEKTKGVGSEVENLGLSFSKLVTADLAADVIKRLASAFVELAKECINTGMEFEKSMSKVKALSGVTGEEFNQLSEMAQQLGASTMFSAQQVADGFSYMALAGWDTKQMLEGIEPVLNLAAAADMNLAEASDIVTDYLTAFGLEAKDASRFTDQLAYAMANSNTDVEMLGEAYKSCAAAAGSMGYSVEDVTSALMTMANAGVKGGEAGTSLRSIMINLATDTNGCASALEEFGVEVYDLETGEMNSLSDILIQTAGAFDGLSDAEANSLAKTIAGKTQFTGFETILLGLNDAAKESGMSFEDYAEALANCDGYAKQVADTMQDNLAGKLTILESSMEGLKIAAYETFDEGLKTSVDAASDAFSTLTDAMKNGDLGDSMRKLGEAFGDIAEDLAKLSETALPELIDGLSWVIDNRGAIEDAFKIGIKASLPNVQDIGLAVKFVDTIKDLITGNTELTKRAEGVAEGYRESAKSFNEARNALSDLTLEERREQEMAIGQEQLIELAEQRVDAEERLAEAKEHLNELEEAMDMGKTVQGYEDAKNAVDIYQESLNGINETYGVLQGQMLGYGAQQDYANQKMAEASQSADENAVALARWSEEGQKAYADALESAQKSLAGQSGLFADLDIKIETSISQMSANLQEQTGIFDQFANDLQRASQLANDGSHPEFLEIVRNIESMGVEGAGYLHMLVEAADNDTEEFTQLMNDWAEMTEARSQLEDTMATFEADYTDGINTLSDKQLEFHKQSEENTTKFTENVKTTVKDATEEVNRNVSDGITTLETTIQTETPVVQQQASTMANTAKDAVTEVINHDSFFEIGDQAGQGLAEGLRSQIENVRAAAQELANAANVGAKGPKGLDEHSPSRTMNAIGRLGGEGLIEGFEETLPELINTINNAMPNENNIEINRFQNLSIGANTAGNGTLEKIDRMLTEYLPVMSQMKVVLDTGATVGALASPMDRALGRLSTRGRLR